MADIFDPTKTIKGTTPSAIAQRIVWKPSIADAWLNSDSMAEFRTVLYREIRGELERFWLPNVETEKGED